LVVFIDASERAFGACAYVQWEVTEGEFSIKSIDPKKRNTEKTDEMWLMTAQENIKKEIKPEKIKCLGVIKEDGILVVNARLETWVRMTKWNPVLISFISFDIDVNCLESFSIQLSSSAF